jgi:succinyl-diaminopimelate desuccinylase
MDLEETISLLKDLISIDTSNPPGNEEEICHYLEKLFSSWNMQSTLMYFAPQRPSFYASIEGIEPGSIILSGHLDTVAPLGSWTRTYFIPVEEEGKIYGLGASDMKGGVAMFIKAFKSMIGKGKPKHTVKLLLSADEEDKYRGAGMFQENGLLDDAIFTIVGEPTEGRVKLAEKSEFWVRTTFIGKEAHGSTPEEGINAIIPQAKFILSLREKIFELSSDPLMGSPTLNVGKITGGRQSNIVPEECSAELDLRLVNYEQKLRVMHIIEEIGQACRDRGKFSMETISYKRPLYSSPDNEFVRSFVSTAERITGIRHTLEAVTYCTDLPTMFPEKTSASEETIPPFVIFGPGSIKQAHQPDEYMEVESLKKSSLTLEEFLSKILF